MNSRTNRSRFWSRPTPTWVRRTSSGSAFRSRFGAISRRERFDPTAHESALEQDPDAGPTEEGGYGIMIVKMVMDDLSYRFADGWNIVRAFRSIHAQVPVATSGSEA